ncbi:MAG: lipid-A-disaccharide synthase [Bdellovibrionales bacterium]|nr:lipid-A-disaccharide synthase [Bdellovibrionales bacterium]
MAPDSIQKIRLFISATEASADLHGAQLLKEVKKKAKSAGLDLQAAGIGGSLLEAEGMSLWRRSTELAVMGLGEVLAKVFKIRRILKETEERLLHWNPDAVILIDGPDFNLRLAKKIQPSAKAYYLIPPKIWVWREGRLGFLRKIFRKLFVIFPFESRFYSDRGMQAEYLGNPLIDELPMSLSKAEARQQIGIAPGAFVICLMPGSRNSEIQRHGELFFQAAHRFFMTKGYEKKGAEILVVLLPGSQDWQKKWTTEIESLESSGIRIRFLDRSAAALRAADVGIIKSGTSTLEAALMGCPHVVVYRVNRLTQLAYRIMIQFLAGYRGPVALANLVAAWDPSHPDSFRSKDAPRVFPELLLDDATVETISDAVSEILVNPEQVSKQAEAMKKVARDLGVEKSPSQRIADALVLDWTGGSA